MGIVPPETEEGDEVCILSGCSVTIILRKHEDGFEEMIGECYMNGVECTMDGQSADLARNGKYSIMEFMIK